jgi:hypothetical protein
MNVFNALIPYQENMEEFLKKEHNANFDKYMETYIHPKAKYSFAFVGLTRDYAPIIRHTLHVTCQPIRYHEPWVEFALKIILLLSMYEQYESPIVRKLLHNPTNIERILLEPYLLEKVLKY